MVLLETPLNQCTSPTPQGARASTGSVQRGTLYHSFLRNPYKRYNSLTTEVIISGGYDGVVDVRFILAELHILLIVGAY